MCSFSYFFECSLLILYPSLTCHFCPNLFFLLYNLSSFSSSLFSVLNYHPYFDNSQFYISNQISILGYRTIYPAAYSMTPIACPTSNSNLIHLNLTHNLLFLMNSPTIHPVTWTINCELVFPLPLTFNQLPNRACEPRLCLSSNKTLWRALGSKGTRTRICQKDYSNFIMEGRVEVT